MANVRFLAVARVADKTIVATHATNGNSKVLEEKTKMVLRSDRVADQRRLTINDKAVGTLHYECDSATLYLVVTKENYSQRMAFSMLAELQKRFEDAFSDTFAVAAEHGLDRKAAPLLAEVAKKYETPEGIDKVSAVAIQVEQVKGVMQQNINSVLRNQDNLDTLLTESTAMAGEASTFSRSANQAKNAMWWKNMKLIIAIIVLFVILIAVVFASVYFNKGAKL